MFARGFDVGDLPDDYIYDDKTLNGALPDDYVYDDKTLFGLGINNDELQMFDDALPSSKSDFITSFGKSIDDWYEHKSEDEKVWLNSNLDARDMIGLTLNGFDILLKMNGVSS